MSFPLHSFFIRSVFGASDSKKKLKFWHIAFFLIGLIADTVGTSLMEHIAELTHLHDEIHTVTGTIAILFNVCACFVGDMDLCERFGKS